MSAETTLILTIYTMCESLLNVFCLIITFKETGWKRAIKMSRERLSGCGTVIMDHLKAMNTTTGQSNFICHGNCSMMIVNF